MLKCGLNIILYYAFIMGFQIYIWKKEHSNVFHKCVIVILKLYELLLSFIEFFHSQNHFQHFSLIFFNIAHCLCMF